MGTISIVFAGVGGQGIVTASDVVASAALAAGWDAKKAETHGMAQRGGAVVSHVRLAPEGTVRSPLIPEGTADYLLALELLEGLRWLWMLRPGGLVVADRRRIDPTGLRQQSVPYPEDAEERLAARGLVLPATDEAAALGEPRAANGVLLGALATRLGLAEEAWRQAFAGCLKPRAVEVNWSAFEVGKALAQAQA